MEVFAILFVCSVFSLNIKIGSAYTFQPSVFRYVNEYSQIKINTDPMI